MPISVAIDGPAGAGKSTIARRAAEYFNFIYIDTGALYRTASLAALKQNVSLEDIDSLKALLAQTKISLSLNEKKQQTVLLNGVDVSGEIRTPEVSMAASLISALPFVRDYLLSLQREIAKEHSVIMDGRDIGTVVLPHANVKVFFTASLEERAKRRYKELKEKCIDVDYKKILQEIRLRDEQDTGRKIAPLKPALGSVILDTTADTPDEAAEKLINVIKEGIS